MKALNQSSLTPLTPLIRSAIVLLAVVFLYAMPVQEARAVITYQSAGVISDSNVTSINPAYPTPVATGNLLIMIVGVKPTADGGGLVVTPEGWTFITSLIAAGGYGAAPAADTGNTNVSAYYKVAEGNETGSLRVRIGATNSAAWAQMYRLTNATQDWSVASATGSDITAGNVSITLSADPGITAGDHILGAMVIPTDITTPAQFSAEAFSQTGVTFGAVTEISEPDTATGNDLGGFVVHSSVSSGTGTAAPVMTATAGGTTTNVRGPGIFIRVRATGAITYQSAGALNYIGATLGTSVCPAHPAAVAAGDLLVTLIGMKPSVANSGSVTTPSGWTAVSSGSLVGAGGYGTTLGADTGNTNVFSFYRVAMGTEATEHCFDLTTNNVAWAQMYRFSNDTQAWLLAGTTGSDITGNAAVSITLSADPGVTAGDHILGAMVIPTDITTPAQFSAEAFSQTGVTFGAVTEISEPDTATGNDLGGFVVHSSVSSGTGTAAPVITATAGGTTTNVRGPGVFVGIREVQPAYTQASFRFYEDGTESGSTAINTQDANVTRNVTPGNSNLQLRLRIQETAAANGLATDDYQLQYSKSAGAYTNVTGASTNVQGFNSASLTEGAATSSRLTGGSGTFLAGLVSEDGLVDNHRITTSRHTEHLYSLTLIAADLANNDTLDFRVLRNGATIGTYSVMPRITVSKVTPGSFNAVEVGTAVDGVIKTKIAGTGFSLDVVAISGGVQQVAFTSPVTVELLGNVATGVPIDAQNCPTSSTLVQTVSPDPTVSAGRVTVDFAAVSNAWRDMRVRVRWPTSAPSVTWCSSDNFAIRPASLTINSVQDLDWASAFAGTGTARNLNNTGVTGGVVHKAGRPFMITATAYNEAATPAVTTNYAGSPTAVAATCSGAGAACTTSFGTVTPGTWSSSSGIVTTTTASYSEVGAFGLQLQDTAFANVDLVDGSTATQRNIPLSAKFDTGRFVPDHFVAATSNTPQFKTFNDAACATRSFTYVGQPFSYSTAPVALLTAKNAAGATTVNYSNSLWKVVSAGVNQSYSATPATPAFDGSTPGAATVSASNDGTGSLTMATGTFRFTRDNATPVAPFDANIVLTLGARDTSENAVTGNGDITTTTPAVFDGGVGAPGIAFDAGNAFRYGRLKLANALGSELLNLPLRLTAQYWNGSGFVTNDLDSCTTLANANATLSNYQGSLTAANMPNTNIQFGAAGTSVFANGIGSLKLIKPSGAITAKGSVDLCVDLGADIAPACTATTPAGKTYLQGNWISPAFDDDPTARATFGVYKGAQEIIYMREQY